MLIGMDAPIYGENKMVTINFVDQMDDDQIIDVSFDDDHIEVCVFFSLLRFLACASEQLNDP